MNLADLSSEERAAIEADKVACFIRKRCGHYRGRERQVCALKLLLGHPEDQRERIKAAMGVRANKQ